MERFGVSIGGIRVLSGAYLRSRKIMDQHYGVINQISLQGRDGLSKAAAEKLEQEYEAQLIQANVLGGHQFLYKYDQFSPFALSVLSDNMKVNKLAGGTYAIAIHLQGRICIVLNAFHPFQLEPYYASSNALVVFECTSERSWKTLRTELAGATDPEQAMEGSLRHQLLINKERLGLAEVNQGSNGIHLSAGPLEGMVELQRFFSEHDDEQGIPYESTCFGRLLLDKGATEEELDRWVSNPELTAGEEAGTAFDLTEEIDAEAAAERLKHSVPTNT